MPSGPCRSPIDTYGGLDVVVNNAGILRDALITRMTETEWDSRDRRAPQGHVQHDPPRVRLLVRRVEGRTPAHAPPSSTPSARPGLQGNPGQANYGAAKAGIAALTVITALEGTRYGVRANAIAPGGATRMVNEAMPSIPVREANEVPDGEFERLNPGNSAPMVAWLASDESLLVSGQVFRAVGNEIAHYLGWHLGPTAANEVKGEAAKWDPARIGTALAKNVFGLQPGGLQMGGR